MVTKLESLKCILNQYQRGFPKLHFHKTHWADQSETREPHQAKYYLEALVEGDFLPCIAPSDRERCRTPSKRACCHYLDQISPKPASIPLEKANNYKYEVIQTIWSEDKKQYCVSNPKLTKKNLEINNTKITLSHSTIITTNTGKAESFNNRIVGVRKRHERYDKDVSILIQQEITISPNFVCQSRKFKNLEILNKYLQIPYANLPSLKNLEFLDNSSVPHHGRSSNLAKIISSSNCLSGSVSIPFPPFAFTLNQVIW